MGSAWTRESCFRSRALRNVAAVRTMYLLYWAGIVAGLLLWIAVGVIDP
jgi:hypothetical protein